MKRNSSGSSVVYVASAAHGFFAATMIALGILGMIKGNFPPTWTGVPKSLPAREVLVYVCAFTSLACGIGLLLQRAAGVASRVLLIYLLLWLLFFRLSHIFFPPISTDVWWGCGDTAVMIAGAWVLYAWFAGNQSGKRFSFATGDKGLRIASVFYGLAMIPFGIAHLVYLKETAALVPGWIPWHVAWVYFTGCAFIAAGVAMLIGVCGRLAAVLSALQIALFTLLVWVPMVWRGGANAFQWSEFLDSWALTAGAWMVADSYRGMPWIARKPRTKPN